MHQYEFLGQMVLIGALAIINILVFQKIRVPPRVTSNGLAGEMNSRPGPSQITRSKTTVAASGSGKPAILFVR